MIKIMRKKDGYVETVMKGEVLDIEEELLKGSIAIIGTLVQTGKLPKEKVIGFIDDFAQQVKDNIKIEEGK